MTNQTFPFLAVIALGSWLIGCSSEPDVDTRRRSAAVVENSGENFAQAVFEVKAVEEYDPQQSPSRVTYHLNRWIATQEPKESWKVDPLYERIAPELRVHASAKNLGRMEFDIDDVQFIRDTSFINQAATWISDAESDEPLASWFADNRESIGDIQMTRLQMAERVFDWIVRNVQLNELLPYAKEAAVGPIQQGSIDSAMHLAPRRGDPGPGYKSLPAETLMFGHGDAWERAQLFILMCRQLSIDVVMLGVSDEERPGRPRPWLPAVLLDDQLYLFDTELGMPIPGPGGVGIATIDQARSDPEILKALDLDVERPYRMHADDIDEVIALVDGTPYFLTQRMSVLSDMLTASDSMQFTASPQEIGDRARKCSGVVSAKIWRASYEALMYHVGKRRFVMSGGPRRDVYLLNTFLFTQPAPLTYGRQFHLLRIFDSSPGFEGAVARYLSSRTPDNELEAFRTDPRVQAAVGLVQGDRQTDKDFERIVRERHAMQKRTKRDATLWLGLCSYEKEDYAAAASWFEGRILQTDPSSPWVPAARYNLARCYEKLGDLRKARELYFEDESAQSHGNVLRGRMLRDRTKTTSS